MTNAKQECKNHSQQTSNASKECSKFSKLASIMQNRNLMFKLDLKNAEEPETEPANIR